MAFRTSSIRDRTITQHIKDTTYSYLFLCFQTFISGVKFAFNLIVITLLIVSVTLFLRLSHCLLFCSLTVLYLCCFIWFLFLLLYSLCMLSIWKLSFLQFRKFYSFFSPLNVGSPTSVFSFSNSCLIFIYALALTFLFIFLICFLSAAFCVNSQF